MKKYNLSAKQVKELYHITGQTLYNWRENNHIEYKKLPSGRYMYSELVPTNKESKRQNVIYSRVSNTKQKDDLVKQQRILREYMTSNGFIVDKIYSDIASGMNSDRNDFNNMISDCFDGKIDKIFITYKDRFIRFGFDYFVNILKKLDVEIVVINATTEEDFQPELTNDLISIIHHFSMKLYSNRRKELKELETKLKNDND